MTAYTDWTQFVECSPGSFMDATAQSPAEKEWVRLNEAARKERDKQFDRELADNIAVGMHTGLRKGTDAMSSMTLWRAISESDDSAWSDAAAFCVYGLKAMGYTITKDDS